MRRPCSRMMTRNLSRALASSCAEPCSVSMKPSIEASGVRNSWLALAMKSTRMRSSRRCSVRSRSVSRAAATAPGAASSGATQTSNRRSIGTRSLHGAVSASPVASTRRIASMTSGLRSARISGSPSFKPGSRANAGLLATIARPSASTTTAGSGIAPTSRSAIDEWSCSAKVGTLSSSDMLVPRSAGGGRARRRPSPRRRGSKPPAPRAASASAAPLHRRRAAPSQG